MSELPDHDSILKSAHGIILFLDDATFDLAPGLIDQKPHPTGGSWLGWAITLTPDLVKGVSQASKIGSGISVGHGLSLALAGSI
jgi:hypothetical protein